MLNRQQHIFKHFQGQNVFCCHCCCCRRVSCLKIISLMSPSLDQMECEMCRAVHSRYIMPSTQYTHWYTFLPYSSRYIILAIAFSLYHVLYKTHTCVIHHSCYVFLVIIFSLNNLSSCHSVSGLLQKTLRVR